MKQHLTLIFILLSVASVIVSFQFDVRWNGIVAWSLAIILLLFAAYFTKYIPEHRKATENEHKTHRKTS